MEPIKENEPAAVVVPNYKPLPPEYEPYEPTNAQKRALERLLRKKRS